MKTLTMPAATGTQNGNFDGISILNRTFPDMRMGVETPILPLPNDAAAPDGNPAADQ